MSSKRYTYFIVLSLFTYFLFIPFGIYKVFASTYGTNFLASCPTPSADIESQPASNAFDGNLSTRWLSSGATPHWLKCDLGSGVSKILNKFELTTSQRTKDIVMYGSNNNTTWDTIISVTLSDNSGVKDTQTFYSTSTTAYRYLKYQPNNRYDANTDQDVYEWTGFECLDCASGTSTISTSMVSDNLLQLLYYFLEGAIVVIVAWFVIKLFR